jgi:hypothetical protein
LGLITKKFDKVSGSQNNMPSLADSLKTPEQLKDMGYELTEPSKSEPSYTPSNDLDPGLNVFIRCPLPQVWSAPTDSLRQFYQGYKVPQIRVFTPTTISSQSGGNVTNITNVSGSSSSGGTSTSTALAITNTSVKTPLIVSGNKFSGSFTLSKAFELLSVTATSACRIQLYGTALAQSADAFRLLDVSPPAGTGQNIICDVVLDTSPYLWSFQNREGANADNPVSSTVYITVTNLDTLSDIITLTFSYIPIVS